MARLAQMARLSRFGSAQVMQDFVNFHFPLVSMGASSTVDVKRLKSHLWENRKTKTDNKNNKNLQVFGYSKPFLSMPEPKALWVSV